MGHTHFQSVLIIYGWTAVLSVGTLLFMFMPVTWVLVILAVGVAACAWVTFSPAMQSKKSVSVVPIKEKSP